MHGVITEAKRIGELALSAYGGWVAGYKLGRAEACDGCTDGVANGILFAYAFLAMSEDSWRKRLLVPYWRGKVVVVLNHLVEKDDERRHR